MGPAEYQAAFEPISDTLRQIPHLAWADLVAWVPESERGDMFRIPRAGFIQWRMIVHAQNLFGTNGPTRMVQDSDGLHFLYMENGGTPFGLEFGKAAEGGLRRPKNANSKNSAMLGQMSFWFYDGEPRRFTLVHTVDGFGLSAHVDRIAVTLESQYGIEWRLILDEGDADEGDSGVTVQPADPHGGPAAPTIVPTTPPPADGEEELPGAAEGVA